ncbi:unnamed protein product [Didymodactylos carnosus]|uniref:Uncharacterized protein n=1 Tax=Didymodactylos carnosus TaxID=1234261 RepID=A0A8S2VD57_9BILA|nr:unnamed protein product [Didymodactylos carnosus]
MSISVTKAKCDPVPLNIWKTDVQSADHRWHSPLAASSLGKLLVASTSSDVHCSEESEMSAGAMEHQGDRCTV